MIRAKWRRRGGIRKGRRYYQSEEEDKKMLISFLKSPIGRHHDSTRFRQLLCPDPSCEVCNNATTEMDQLLFSLAQEDAALSVPPLASIAPVTEPLFTESPAFSAVPPGYLIPLPLPEPFPPHPSIVSPNPVTPLGDFPSPSPWIHSLPPEPFPSWMSEMSVKHSTPQTLNFPSPPPHDSQRVETPLTLNTIFLDSSITQHINPTPDLAERVNPTKSVTCHHLPPTLSVSTPPDCTVTVTQPKSIFISSKPVLENSPQDRVHALSTHVPEGSNHPSPSSYFFCQKSRAKDSLPSTLARCDFHQEISGKNVRYDSEKDLDSYMMSPSGQSVSQQHLEDDLEIHLNKKFKEISDNRLPRTVYSSWYGIRQTVSVKSQTKVKQRSLPPSMDRAYCLNTSNELSFLESSAQQMLEAHITKFHMKMLWGLPAKVLESIEIFKQKDTSSHSMFSSNSSSLNHLFSKVDSKTGGFMPL
ncbi:hypothetical protein HJG60_009726 [Phyllostomus discolor]|uniref:Spermatogenesis-associated protein 31D3-like n=1 Tax=Phyllostomus discolor TaxID=89673 RepID=A0A834B2F6_9CHIR|nr:hypothetical protein HJG60_009726 [Phyllostomus discolor]